MLRGEPGKKRRIESFMGFVSLLKSGGLVSLFVFFFFFPDSRIERQFTEKWAGSFEGSNGASHVGAWRKNSVAEGEARAGV